MRCHLKEKINFHLREIEERGLRYKFETMARVNQPKFVVKQHENVVIMSVSDLRGVFLVWISGCFLSSVVFVVEILSENYYRRKNTTK